MFSGTSPAGLPTIGGMAMRIHGVTPAFIRQLEAAGYVKVPVEKLISMKIHGVDAKFIRSMSK